MVAIIDDNKSSWEQVLGRVLGGINGVLQPGEVTIRGSNPTVYSAGTGTAGTTDYTPLILIALVVVAIVVLSKS